MRIKINKLISLLLIMGTFVFFASSCKKDELPVLTTAAITDITHNTAKSGGNITSDGGSEVIARGVCWSTHETPTISDNITTDGTGVGSFVSNVSGLSVNTVYYVRAYATNSTGTGYGNTISFTSANTFTDPRDGNLYKAVTIGTQTWMGENLKYLPNVVGPSTGSKTTPYYYVYGYNGTSVIDAKLTDNYITYGVLYNWPAVMNGASSSITNPSGVKGACPDGWHLPSDAEWTALIDYLGGKNVAGGKLKETGTTHWSRTNGLVTNETGFTALPGGYRIDGIFSDIRNAGTWWSATEDTSDLVWVRSIGNYYNSVSRYSSKKEYGFSVRCVRD
jgi:uncharacterized protein (TIGR02145 family)